MISEPFNDGSVKTYVDRRSRAAWCVGLKSCPRSFVRLKEALYTAFSVKAIGQIANHYSPFVTEQRSRYPLRQLKDGLIG
jgi:hypothetical protein